MNMIIWGLVCIFIDLNLTIGQGRIDIIPDFLGYILIASGMMQYAAQSESFRKMRPLVLIVAAISGLVYMGDMIGAFPDNAIQTIAVAVLTTFFYLMTTYYICHGIRELGVTHNRNLNADGLMTKWTILMVCQILTFCTIIIPVLMVIFIIASFIVNIIFIVQISQSNNLLNAPEASLPAVTEE